MAILLKREIFTTLFIIRLFREKGKKICINKIEGNLQLSFSSAIDLKPVPVVY